MSASSQNLIELQSALQDPARVTMQDLMKYANGGNPEVPSFLALIELNRRKQIEQTAQNFEQPQGTVKDQTIQALLTGAPQNQVNPTAAPQGINPGAAPSQINPAQLQQQVMPGQAPQQQIDPTASPQPMKAAEGGLMSIPVNNMFKAKSYAGGGIVAFAGGGKSEDKYVETPGGLNVLESELPADQRAQSFPERARYQIGNQEILGPRSIEEIMGGIPEAPSIGARPDDMSIEQAMQRQKEIQKAAGVAEDPYSEVKQRQSRIEARQEEQRKGDAIDRLLAMAEGFATADPTKGFGYHMASASKASRSLQAEQQVLQDKQEQAALEFHRAMAKEEDARRRGDANGIQSAITDRMKAQQDYDKLSMDRERLNQGRYKTAADIRQAEATEAKTPIDIFNAETQRKNQESLDRYHQTMAETSRLSRPSAEDRAYDRANALFERSSFIQNLAKQIKELGASAPESDEYKALIREYNKHKRAFFAAELKKHPDMDLRLLDESGQQDASPKESPGFWESVAKGWNNYKGIAPANKTVSFDQLPK